MNFGSNIIVFLAFAACAGATLAVPRLRRELWRRSRWDWIIDGSGLVFQGMLVPLLQLFVVAVLADVLWPGMNGQLAVSPMAAFLLSFVAVDYLYYWNHRLLHTNPLWPWHVVHHSARNQDFLITSRNTFWTPLLIIYMWVNGLMVHWLADPTWYLVGVATSAALDLWHHTKFVPATQPTWFRALRMVLVTPIEHGWHHHADGARGNFGANFILWDKLHGTFRCEESLPPAIGMPLPAPGWRQLLIPVFAKERRSPHAT